MSYICIVNKHSLFSLFTFVFLFFTQEMLGLGSSSRTQQQPQQGRGPMAPQQQEVHNRYHKILLYKYQKICKKDDQLHKVSQKTINLQISATHKRTYSSRG